MIFTYFDRSLRSPTPYFSNSLFFAFLQNQSQYERHLEADRQRKRRERANESQEQREARQLRDRMWHQHDRMQEAAVRPLSSGKKLERAGFSYDVTTFNAHTLKIWDIGRMNHVCPICHAKKFKLETKGMCCGGGGKVEKDIHVPRIPKPPEELLHLFDLDTQEGKNFIGNSRKYNSAFQMSSILTQWEALPGFMPTVKISGHLYHRMGPLMPSEGEQPKFLQIYFIGNFIITFNDSSP